MPLQNRVTPSGDIIATPHRGMFTGNRGIIHDPATKTADAALGQPGVAHLRLRIQGPAARGDGRPQLDRTVLSRRGHRVRGRASPVLLLPPRRRQPVSRRVGGRAMASRHVLARDIDAVLHRERLAGGKKRLHALPMPLEELPDGAMVQAGSGELSDRAGPGAGVVAGRLSRGAERARRCHAADAALDVAGAVGAVSAGAASECSEIGENSMRRDASRRAACPDALWPRGVTNSGPRQSDASRELPNLTQTSALPASPRAERHQLRFGDIAMHRRHAAIGGRDDVALRHEFRDGVDHLGDIFRGLDGVAGDVDHAGLHDLAGEQAEQFQRHPRVAAFDRDLLDRAFRRSPERSPRTAATRCRAFLSSRYWP